MPVEVPPKYRDSSLPRPVIQRAAEMAAVVPGRVLEVIFAAAGRIRPTAKPLHPTGAVRAASIETRGLGGDERTGVAWIDRPGTTRALVRLSRATGLPASLPDIHGMAVRMRTSSGGPADLLLASTGLGRVARFCLTPSYSAADCAFSTLFPYRTDAGPLLIAAWSEDADPDRFVLGWARPSGAWTVFGTMRLKPGEPLTSGDSSMSFDPVLHQPDGLDYYPWAARLRRGAYRAARSSRDAEPLDPGPLPR